jgi:hypothetical protein
VFYRTVWFQLGRLQARFLYFLDRFIVIEEVKKIRKLVYINYFEKSIVVVLKFFFPFLNECLISASKEFTRRKDRQLVFIFALFATDVQIAHIAEPLLEGPMLVLLWIENLNSRQNTSIVYQTVPLSLWTCVNLMRYFGSLFIRLRLCNKLNIKDSHILKDLGLIMFRGSLFLYV